MKTLSVLALITSFTFVNVKAQNQIKTFTFEKGEILDIIISTNSSDFNKLVDRYRKEAFPVAFEYTYQPQSGFSVSRLTLGNYFPQNFIFGKWSTRQKRDDFLANISKRVPDFHEQRRAIFTYFALTYFEVPEDLQFSINSDKYNVATSFWENDSLENFDSFYNEWKNLVIKSGGQFLLELQDGTSPTGYYYNPNVLTIVQWESVSAFDRFAKEWPLSRYEMLKDVHQFVID